MTSRTTRPAGGVPAALTIRDLRKDYGQVAALDGVDLDVRPGEFVTLLGPSGSGKTTTLRLVAGFSRPSSGTIEIHGVDMSHVPPHRRDVGMIFQNYALFPHLTAAENIAFPLQMRGIAKPEISKRVAGALKLVNLTGLDGRYPRQLSGGQQQRVAFARATVFNPRILLMDEPLGALDKKLRDALQLEIMHMSRELGATVVYVTHDQEEALVMSDRIAIFNKGRIEQLGTGEDLYSRPMSMFVADFIGEATMLRGVYHRDASGGWLERNGVTWRVDASSADRAELAPSARAALVIRPERLKIRAEGDPITSVNVIDAVVRDVRYLGSMRRYDLEARDGATLVVRQQFGGDDRPWGTGDAVRLTWAIEDAAIVADEPLPEVDDHPKTAVSGRPTNQEERET